MITAIKYVENNLNGRLFMEQYSLLQENRKRGNGGDTAWPSGMEILWSTTHLYRHMSNKVTKANKTYKTEMG
jgi:hypothetical protein